MLSGFPGVLPPRTLGGGPCLWKNPTGRATAPPRAVPVGQAQGPLREVVEGSSLCSPEGRLTEREVPDSHAADRATSRGTRRVRIVATWTVSVPFDRTRGQCAPQARGGRCRSDREGMCIRTPFRGMPLGRTMPHTQGRSCFPAFPFVKPGGLVPAQAARTGWSPALPHPAARDRRTRRV